MGIGDRVQPIVAANNILIAPDGNVLVADEAAKTLLCTDAFSCAFRVYQEATDGGDQNGPFYCHNISQSVTCVLSRSAWLTWSVGIQYIYFEMVYKTACATVCGNRLGRSNYARLTFTPCGWKFEVTLNDEQWGAGYVILPGIPCSGTYVGPPFAWHLNPGCGLIGSADRWGRNTVEITIN